MRGDFTRQFGPTETQMIRSTIVGNAVFRMATAIRGESEMFPLIDSFYRLEQSSELVIRSYVAAKLARLLSYAGHHVEKYRPLIPSMDHPADAYSVLLSLPETSKEEIKKASKTLVASNSDLRIHSKTTGGSTGGVIFGTW